MTKIEYCWYTSGKWEKWAQWIGGHSGLLSTGHNLIMGNSGAPQLSEFSSPILLQHILNMERLGRSFLIFWSNIYTVFIAQQRTVTSWETISWQLLSTGVTGHGADGIDCARCNDEAKFFSEESEHAHTWLFLYEMVASCGNNSPT